MQWQSNLGIIPIFNNKFRRSALINWNYIDIRKKWIKELRRIKRTTAKPQLKIRTKLKK